MKALLALIAVIVLFWGNAIEKPWMVLTGGLLAMIVLIISIIESNEQ